MSIALSVALSPSPCLPVCPSLSHCCFLGVVKRKHVKRGANTPTASEFIIAPHAPTSYPSQTSLHLQYNSFAAPTQD